MAEREEERVIRLICDNLDVAIHIVDRNMKIIYANTYWDKLTRGNLRSVDMVGKSPYELFPFLLKRGVDKEYKQVFKTGDQSSPRKLSNTRVSSSTPVQRNYPSKMPTVTSSMS